MKKNLQTNNEGAEEHTAKQTNTGTEEQKPLNIEVLITHGVFYFIAFPAILMLIHLSTGNLQGWLYYLSHGFFFALFMTTFDFFQKRKKR